MFPFPRMVSLSSLVSLAVAGICSRFRSVQPRGELESESPSGSATGALASAAWEQTGPWWPEQAWGPAVLLGVDLRAEGRIPLVLQPPSQEGAEKTPVPQKVHFRCFHQKTLDKVKAIIFSDRLTPL